MPDARCTLEGHGAGLRARFDVPQWAPTPGQYLVVYDGDVCLGGAVIAGGEGEPPIAQSDVRDTLVAAH
jgi:tRNA-specific 2-thiouridylase